MTEQIWLTCGSRQEMRGTIKSRPFAPVRWLLFNLACVERVRDLLADERCTRFAQELTRCAADPALLPFRSFHREVALVREAIHELWGHRTDPRRNARVAAARAVQTAHLPTFATSEMVIVALRRLRNEWGGVRQPEQRIHCNLLRDIFGNPFRPVAFDLAWRTDTAVSLARGMYESRDFSAMPILADSLQDAGCENADILTHCRDARQEWVPGDYPAPAVHVRGCWVVDLVLGKA